MTFAEIYLATRKELVDIILDLIKSGRKDVPINTDYIDEIFRED